jgi:signal transduction histidine kinase
MTVAAAPPSIRQMLAELAGLVGFGAAFVSRICGGTHEIVEVADAHDICPRPGTTLSLDLTCFGRPSAGAPGDLSCLALLEPLGIRSYALAPLRGDAGSLVGTLVLLDRTDVELTDRSRTALDLFASMLSRQQQDSAVQAERDDGRRSIAGRERRGRLRLAAQLHDGPIQQVVAARLLLEGAAGPAPSSGIRAAVEAMDQGILELRELLGAVQPGTLDAAELTESLSSAARNVNPGAKILIRVPDDPDGQDMVVMGELHRMALELLTNVRKHANGELRHFAFVVRDGRAVVRVVDAGPGGCPQRSPQGHYGLSSLQETARLLGGAVMVRSGAIGTTVTVRVAA